MSRELKFRARNGKEMSSPFTLDDEHTTFDDCRTYRNIHRELTLWEVMQFTGLQDKNGVDIYEGDKLRCTQFDDDEYTKEVEVRFGEGGFSSNYHSYIGFYCVDSNGDEDDIGDMIFNGKHDREIEVIGTIHEVKS